MGRNCQTTSWKVLIEMYIHFSVLKLDLYYVTIKYLCNHSKTLILFIMKIYTVYYKWPFGTICNIFCGKRYTYFFNEIFYNSKLYNKMIDLWMMKILGLKYFLNFFNMQCWHSVTTSIHGDKILTETKRNDRQQKELQQIQTVRVINWKLYSKHAYACSWHSVLYHDSVY